MLLRPSIREYNSTIEYSHIINISSMYLFVIEIFLDVLVSNLPVAK